MNSIVCANHSNSLTDALFVQFYTATRLEYLTLVVHRLLVTSIPTKVSYISSNVQRTSLSFPASEYAAFDRQGNSIRT